MVIRPLGAERTVTSTKRQIMKRTVRAGVLGTTLLAMVATGVGVAPGAYAKPDDRIQKQIEKAAAQAERQFPVKSVDTDVDVRISEEAASAAITAPGGASVSLSARDAADSVAVAKPDGAQVMTVLREGESEASYDISLPAGTTLEKVGQAYEVVVDGHVVVGQVQAPWAIDANGKSLKTSYDLRNTTLVQTVETKGAAYPITVDPRVSIGVLIYVRYSRAEVRTQAGASSVVFVTSLASTTCGKLLKWYGSYPCAASIAAVGFNLINTFSLARDENKCVEITFLHPVPVVNGWRRYSTNPTCHSS